MADVLVLPDQERIQPGAGHRRAGAREPALAQGDGVGTVLVIQTELTVGEPTEV